MAAARRRMEIATDNHGKIRAQHPKEGEPSPSLPLRPSGRAHLTARGLAREGPPARAPKTPGSPWWPRAGCFLTGLTSRGQM